MKASLKEIKREINDIERGKKDICKISEDAQKYLNRLNPSQVYASYYIYAKNKKKIFYPYREDSPFEISGKWLIFQMKGGKLDNVWKEVKRLTEKGLLVDECKVSAMIKMPDIPNKDVGVICVYTYNSNDKKDLLRVAKRLFNIKGVERLVYKENIPKDDKKSKYVVTKDNYRKILQDKSQM